VINGSGPGPFLLFLFGVNIGIDGSSGNRLHGLLDCMNSIKKNGVIHAVLFYALIAQLHAQPVSGCYLGAYLGGGSVDLSAIGPGAFNQLTGKKHAVFTRYMNCGSTADLLSDKNWVWADTLQKYGANPAFFLMPYDGLKAYTDGSRDADLDGFAVRCRDFGSTVFILFAHEMNTPWPPWGQKPDDYRAAFVQVSSRLKSIAPLVQMCWIPGQAWGYPWGGGGTGNGYDEYYPGDEYVDWVGLTVYDRDWNENNSSEPDLFNSAVNHLYFYTRYAKDKGKSMMIAETALFDANWDPTSGSTRQVLTPAQLADEKNQWISQVYNLNNLIASFRYINLIVYFHVLKKEDFSSENHQFGNISVDWRIPASEGYEVYKERIQTAYFRSQVITGIENSKIKAPDYALMQNFPNPFNPLTRISYSLRTGGHVKLSVYDLLGRELTVLADGYQAAGTHTAIFDGAALPSGLYFYRMRTDAFNRTRKMILTR